MDIYNRFILPLLLRYQDPEDAHIVVSRWLQRIGKTGLASVVERYFRINDSRLKCNLMGLEFPNPVGLAAGFDKGGKLTRAMQMLGFGFVEVGSVTVLSQDGPPRPRIHRLPEEGALINLMRFNNPGIDSLVQSVATDRRFMHVPVGVSLGCSHKAGGDIETIIKDYLEMLQAVYEHGDYFVINISCPGIIGLRQMHGRSELNTILTGLREKMSALATFYREVSDPKPLLVKLSPDLSFAELDEVIATLKFHPTVHIVATNTTTSRADLPARAGGYPLGGLSGKPLRNRAAYFVQYLRQALPDRVIIGSGGICSPADAAAMLFSSGANLVQLYTGLIYYGPELTKDINLDLLARLRRVKAGSLREILPA